MSKGDTPMTTNTIIDYAKLADDAADPTPAHATL